MAEAQSNGEDEEKSKRREEQKQRASLRLCILPPASCEAGMMQWWTVKWLTCSPSGTDCDCARCPLLRTSLAQLQK